MGGIMKNMARLSVALIMFSVFSVSYLVTSVSAQPPMGQHQGMAPGTGMGMGQHKGMPATGAPYMGAPGMMAPGTSSASGSSYTTLREPGTGPHDGPGDALSHCANFSGAPRAACEAAAAGR